MVVQGVGDVACWLPMMGGSLDKLAGGFHLTFSPNLADDDSDKIKAAHNVAAAILR